MSETTQQPQFKVGQICHTEVVTNDVPGSKKFFEDVFGWSYDEQPMPGGEGTYAMWKVGDQVHGGVTAPMQGMPPSTLNYLYVPNVDEYVKKIEGAGGKVLNPGMDVGEFGRMAVFEAPGGTVMALWQSFEG